jgi:hypothetical protein
MENKQLAQGIASLGRYGDTTLMHMRPDEVEQLTAISRANGGDITINPDTGMPEAFLGDFLGALAPFAAGIGANALLPGSGSAFAMNNPFLYKYAIPAAAGIGAKAVVNGGDLSAMDVLSGGFGGYGGAQFGSSLSQFGAEAAKTPVTEQGLTGMSPVDTTQGINMSTGQTVGGTGQTFTPRTYAAGSGGNLGSGALRTQGGVGIPPSTPNQVYQAGPDRLYQPNMNQVNYPTYADGIRQDAINTGGYDPLQGQGSSALSTKGGQGFNVDTVPAVQDSFKEGFNFGQSIADSKLGKGFQAAAKDPMGYLKSSEVGDGSALAGGIKTALPFTTAAGEAYMKGYYDDMPSYETSTAGMYDPTRRLNLGMDTGLRLLARGGRVAFEEGGVVRDRSYYGIEPQYNTTGATYSPIMGMQGGRQTRAPVQGFVDVGGKFVADPKGTMTDVDYENRFKYVTEGVAKPGDQSGGDFEARAGMQGDAGGINPAVALQAAQGYAESQQSNLDEQGLGTLKTGGSVRRFQMGGTTAERNMYGSQDTNEPTGLGTLTTAEQNLPGRMGMAGRTDLQNATTAEQNIAREPMQEAGTVVSSPMQNTMGAQPNDMVSRLPMGPTDMNANVTESLGQALQSNPQGFTVIPNQSIPPTSGEAPMMAMGGRVRYAEGGISALTPDDGKMLNGNGDGVSDDIPAMIEGEQEAALSDGEFIVPARIVSELGNGSSDAGAKKLYAMIDRIQAARQKTMGDNKQYAKDTNAERFLPV